MAQVRRAVSSTTGRDATIAQRGSYAAIERPIFVNSLRHPTLRLRSPMAVSLIDDGEQIIAAAYDLDTFGYGDSDSEALDDLRRAVVDLYATLKDNSDSLGPLPKRIREYLSDAFARVP